VNSNRIYNETATALQLEPSEMNKYTHNAVVQTDANVLVLNVTGPDPQKAAMLANSIGQRSINYIKGLYQAYDINLLDPAIPPTAPISPQPLRDAGLAAGLGFVLGSLLAILAGSMQGARPASRPVRRENVAATYSGQYVQRR
jgi:receptor protein-tyrosine kinase